MIEQSIVILLLLIKVQSSFNLSMKINEVDDCVTKIYTNKSIYYDFSKNFKFPSDCNFDIIKKYNIYDKLIIKNVTYAFGELIYLEAYDGGGPGYLDITVFVNEIIVNIKDQKFWKCLNCDSNDQNYIYSYNGLYFHTGDNPQ
jgi:hypothetical protein